MVGDHSIILFALTIVLCVLPRMEKIKPKFIYLGLFIHFICIVSGRQNEAVVKNETGNGKVLAANSG